MTKYYYEYSINTDFLESFVVYKSLRNYETNTLNAMTVEDIELIKTLKKAAFVFFDGKTQTEKSLEIVEQCLYDVTYIIFSSDAGTKLASILNISIEDKPQLWIIDYSDGFDRPIKFKFNFDEYKKPFVFEFMRLYRNKQLTRHLISQKVEASKYENNVLVLSSDNYSKVVDDVTKEVIVFFYRNNCPQCEGLLKPYEKVAKKFTSDNSIIFAKINLSENDLTFSQSTPNIKFYTSHFKSGFEFNDKIENLPFFVLDYRTMDKSKNSRDSYGQRTFNIFNNFF